MVWIDNILDLQYYNQPAGAPPCYCELLVYANDLQLQGTLSGYPTTLYNMQVLVYSADGLNQLEDATSSFEWYFFINPFTNETRFNLRLKTFTAIMCSTACYILRVRVTTLVSPAAVLFDRYTERYCQASCCDVPRDITITQQGVHPESGSVRVLPPDFPIDPPELPEPVRPTGECGRPLIRITTAFTCWDNETGDYYGLPDSTISGTAGWQFKKVTNIEGHFAERSAEIVRTISYNCRLQRSEKFRPYFLESFVLFPTWKKDELEGGFMSDNIYVNDFVKPEKEYGFAGGTVTRLISPATKCWELFKLEATLQDCTRRQTFGCGDNCTNPSQTRFYGVPMTYRGTGFYTEGRSLVGEDLASMMAYYRNQDGVQQVTDLSGSYPELYGAFSVTGIGYTQPSFYIDTPTAPNRVFGGPFVPVATPVCPTPVAGTAAVFNEDCPTPVAGSSLILNEEPTVATVTGFGDWDAEGTASVVDRIVTLSFTAINPNLTDPDPVTFTWELIASVGAAARPTVTVILSNEQFGQIPEGSYLTIDTTGNIRWSGPGMSITEAGTHIALADLQYDRSPA